MPWGTIGVGVGKERIACLENGPQGFDPYPQGENGLILGSFWPSAEVGLPHFGLTLTSFWLHFEACFGLKIAFENRFISEAHRRVRWRNGNAPTRLRSAPLSPASLHLGHVRGQSQTVRCRLGAI